MRARYAASMPGRLGDCIYVLPFLRYVYGVTGEKIDFYTSDYCKPLRMLFEYQPCINSFNILDKYVIERHDMGTQPWHMPIPEGYEQVFQLGFQSVPDRAIHQFIAAQQGIGLALGVRYEVPIFADWATAKDYICIAPRGQTSFQSLFDELADRTNAVIIGGTGDYTGHGRDYTGLDLLKTAFILSRSSGFVGLMSSQLVLANGFDIPRIAPHDGKSWDMRHVIYSAYNHYPVNPSVDDVVALLKDNT